MLRRYRSKSPVSRRSKLQIGPGTGVALQSSDPIDGRDPVSHLFGSIFASIETAMRFRVARQGLLAANVANADTPGYKRVDLRFEERFERAALALDSRGARHFASADARHGGRLVRDRSAARIDGNNVNLDRELVQLSRNAGAFTKQAAVLSRMIELRRTAIDGRG